MRVMNVAAGHPNHRPGPTQLPASLHRWPLQPGSKASGLAGSSDSKSSLAPPPPNWHIRGSQLPSMWGWMGLSSLSRAHPLARCFSPLPPEWRGEAGDVGPRVGHHPGCSSHVLAPPGLSSLLCRGCQKAVSAFLQRFKGSTLLRYTRGGKQSPARRHLHHLLMVAIQGWLLWWGQGWSQRSWLALINH